MTLSTIENIINRYSFSNREKEGLTDKARSFLHDVFTADSILFIGFGGTISSGYSPTHETIIPLIDSPALRSVEHINNFGISNIRYNHIPLLAKDSRRIDDEDVFTLLDIIFLCPNHKICITVGTYMGPKIAAVLFNFLGGLGGKKIVFTGSMLPAGFSNSDADANIWSAVTILDIYTKYFKEISKVALVFHGHVYDSKEQIENLDLHPETSKDIILGYPDLRLPIIT